MCQVGQEKRPREANWAESYRVVGESDGAFAERSANNGAATELGPVDVIKQRGLSCIYLASLC